jgi:hypothetical protein
VLLKLAPMIALFRKASLLVLLKVGHMIALLKAL